MIRCLAKHINSALTAASDSVGVSDRTVIAVLSLFFEAKGGGQSMLKKGMVMGEPDTRQVGDSPSHSGGCSITVTEDEFCDAVSAAVRRCFAGSNDHTAAGSEGLIIAIDAFDRLRDARKS